MPQTLDTISNARLQPAMWPEDARWTAARFTTSVTIARGTVLGKITATGVLAAYANANSDGTETAVAIAMYDMKTDANGRVYFVSGSTAAVETAEVKSFLTAPVYIAGTFDAADLTGEDANALTDFKASTLFNGLIRIP
jgi:hypothetical protein